MAAYNSSHGSEVNAEFARTILETMAAFKREDVRLSWILPMGKVRTLPLVKLVHQMGSGCGTFASSSPLEGDIDYSHRPNLGADEKVRISRETIR